jgi:hypothetical protein
MPVIRYLMRDYMMWGDMRDEITGLNDIRYTRGQFLGLAYLHPVPII